LQLAGGRLNFRQVRLHFREGALIYIGGHLVQTHLLDGFLQLRHVVLEFGRINFRHANLFDEHAMLCAEGALLCA
jgi:hypothetical protein